MHGRHRRELHGYQNAVLPGPIEVREGPLSSLGGFVSDLNAERSSRVDRGVDPGPGCAFSPVYPMMRESAAGRSRALDLRQIKAGMRLRGHFRAEAFEF